MKKNLLAVLNAPCADNEELCAVPYNRDLPSFYFSSFEEYEERLTVAKQIDLIFHLCGDFEHEVQFIDGEGGQWLVDAFGCNIEGYYEFIDESNSDQIAALFYLVTSLGYSIEIALEKVDEVMLTTEALKDYAFDRACESGELSDFAKMYFNSEQYAEVLECNGDVHLFNYDGQEYLVTNHSGL
ncbi:hypothetical protein [Endozoicomonas sp. ALB115]|uniref:hypothetical protein n=1 Tax=Endozoicomonas sp. ALB115 TaxID=3403074 RepID=UPI003BB80B18